MTLPAPFTSARPPPPPPRLLLVNKFTESRAPELESLHSIVSNRLNHDFRLRRDKRRRTAGYRSLKNNRRKRPRLLDGVFPAVGNGGAEAPVLYEKEAAQKVSKLSRRVRRRLELRRNPAFGFCVSGNGTKRLRTHLWHAKRFTMGKRWGFYMPLGLQGRGKGSRAVLKWLKSGALVHDYSYSYPVQLEGPEESIMSIMRMVLQPFPSGISEQISKTVVYGACYANSMLYKVSSPHPKFIAPVIYMWRPRSYHNHLDSEHLDGCTTSRSECSTSLRQLWIWIHTASYNEGFDALRYACEKQMNDNGVSVQCLSMEGHIAILEVIGSKSFEILQKVLIPVPLSHKTGSKFLSSCSSLRPCSNSQPQSNFILEHADQLPPHAIFSLEVQDPRNLSLKETKITKESDGNKESVLPIWLKPEANEIFLSGNRQLWDSYLNLKPPLPENVLCSEKNNNRLKLFYLDSPHFGKSGCVAKDDYDLSCPIILLKHANLEHFGSRWSVIFPLSWAKPFWMSFISNGAHAIGLREKRWIASNHGLPSFPFDFPDSSAYSSLMIAEATKADEVAKLRPPAVRPIDVPLVPPWHCIAYTLHKGFNTESLYKDSSFENYEESFTISIQRTSNDLNFVFKESCCEGYLYQGGGPFFVRVLIHAFKEGSFEEGAVVCAPVLIDLPAWRSRSEEHAPLQMPQSFVKSYFTRQDSDTWELNVPQDSSTLQWFRWPIGFITTGFVRGSRKPMAVAFCEAKILKKLKEQQEKATDSTNAEIFVLVRNLKSNTYRHAVANIILDKQEEDLDFM